MRTTIDLPDDLYREAKARAALSGIPLKQLITRWVERGLREPADSGLGSAPDRSPLPVVVEPRGRHMPALSNEEIEALLDADDIP